MRKQINQSLCLKLKLTCRANDIHEENTKLCQVMIRFGHMQSNKYWGICIAIYESMIITNGIKCDLYIEQGLSPGLLAVTTGFVNGSD